MSPPDRAQILFDVDAFVMAKKMKLVDELKLIENYYHEDDGIVWSLLNRAMSRLLKEAKGKKYEEQFLQFANWLYGKAYDTFGWTVQVGEKVGKTIERAAVLKQAIQLDHRPAIDEALRLFDTQMVTAELYYK